MNIVDYAKNELEIAGLFDEDADYDGMALTNQSGEIHFCEKT